MDWKEHYRRKSPLPADASLADQLIQVGKTELGQPVDPKQLQLIEQQIVSALMLDTSPRHVVDLGCGNGLITHRIASYCQSMIAIDVSETMIGDAKRTPVAIPIQYVVAEIDRLPKRLHDTNVGCGYSYEVWQHLNMAQASECLRSIRQCFPKLDRFVFGVLAGSKQNQKILRYPQAMGVLSFRA
jgi:2-polyprenyl-3-methyl-5-hydroxy-6-metoxy-1,4-benzoquinol methylase